MKKLTMPEPTLKIVKDFCYMGIVKASQRLSFNEEEDNEKAVNSTFTLESMIDLQGSV